MLFPIISAVTESFATIIDKFNLNLKKIKGGTFTSILLIFMALFSLPLMCFFEAKPGAFTLYPIFIMFLIITGSAIQNTLFYVGLRNKNLSSLEPIRNSESILIILLAFLIFPSERNIVVFILGVITTLALIYSHLEKNELKKVRIAFDKYTLFVLLSMFISALLALSYKYILAYYPPLSLYLIRAIGVGVILAAVYRPKITSIKTKQLSLFTIAALLYSAAAIFQYFAIVKVGVAVTVLILTLSPSIIYLFSKILLKEKLTANKIISSVVIVACVIVAVVFV